MPTDTLPELTTAYPIGDEQVAAYRAHGFLRLSGVADAGEAAAYRGPVAAAVERLSTETRPLAERDSYGMAFLQVMNLWRHDESVARFVHGLPVRRRGRQAARGPAGAALPRPGAVQGARRRLHPVAPGRDVLAARRRAVPHDVDATGGHHAGDGWARLRQRQPRRRALSDMRISDASEEHFARLVAEGAVPAGRAGGDARRGRAASTTGWTVHKALRNASGTMREVMTVIWFADGLTVLEPPTRPRQDDLAAWLPGLRPGDVAASASQPRPSAQPRAETSSRRWTRLAP